MSGRFLIDALRHGEGQDLTPTETLVLWALAICHNQELQRCDPPVSKLVKMTGGLSRRSVQRSLVSLCKKRIISITHRATKIGDVTMQRTSNYRVLPCATVTPPPRHGDARKSPMASASAPTDLIALFDIEMTDLDMGDDING
jgi:hypothetical protein